VKSGTQLAGNRWIRPRFHNDGSSIAMRDKNAWSILQGYQHCTWWVIPLVYGRHSSSRSVSPDHG
jgi:hypothetical protein